MIVSAETFDLVGHLFVCLGLCISAFGICTNIVNIAIFLRQGLKDRTNTGLMALAVSDLGSLLTQAWATVSFTDPVIALDLPFEPEDIQYLIASCPRLSFTRVTTCITAYLSLEKCLCVVVPLKVKNFFTRQRILIYVVLVYVLMFASLAPVYYTTRFAWVRNPQTNTTILGIAFINNPDDFQTASFYINNAIPLIAFIIIIICTVILTHELNRRSLWRQRTSLSTRIKTISQRDVKLIKMVACISIVFILCYTPGTLLFLWMLLSPEMRIQGQEKNMFLICSSVLFVTEGANASTTLFVYLSMSSKFLRLFQKMFPFAKLLFKPNRHKT